MMDRGYPPRQHLPYNFFKDTQIETETPGVVPAKLSVADRLRAKRQENNDRVARIAKRRCVDERVEEREVAHAATLRAEFEEGAAAYSALEKARIVQTEEESAAATRSAEELGASLLSPTSEATTADPVLVEATEHRLRAMVEADVAAREDLHHAYGANICST
jgi:hypothetical protein